MTAATKRAVPPSNLASLIQRGQLLPLSCYQKIIVAFSGGKDSLALGLMLLDMGVRPENMEWWHHLIDAPGQPRRFDWPCTEGYVRAVGRAFGVPVRFSWKDGGFEGELFREDSPTKGVYYEDEHRELRYLPPAAAAEFCKCRRRFDDERQAHCPECGALRRGFGTRLKYPMPTANLSTRWCSPYLKIDVAKRVLSNDPRFASGRFLMLTGERRQESDARQLYQEAELHRSSNSKRRVHHWRGVIDWREEDVWAMIERHRVLPHPCYYVGFSRCSCMCCIFNDRGRWAAVKQLAPERFDWHAANERRFALTIKPKESVERQAACGDSALDAAPPWAIRLAMAEEFPADRVFVPADEPWRLPMGAYRRQGGPT